jgi:ribose transport system substrate-binding protein
MRRNTIFTVAVVAAMTLSLGACSRGGTSSAATTTSGSGGAAAGKTAALVISTLDNPFFVSVAAGAKAEATKLGMSLNIQNADNTDETSLDLATSALTKQPSVLIIDPVSSASGGAIVKEANSDGVPAVAFDRVPSGGTLKAFIGYDAIQAGRNAANALGQALDGKGSVVEITGTTGTSVAQQRSQGFEAGIKAFPGIKIVATQTANFDRGTALNVMTNILQSNHNIAGVYAANDEMALGVIAALQAAGQTGKIKVVGNDGIADAVTALKAGTLYATNAESPYALGVAVMSLAANVANGKPVDKDKVLQGFIVKAANVASYCSKLAVLGDNTTCK